MNQGPKSVDWLDATLRAPALNQPPQKPKTWFSTALSTLGLSSPQFPPLTPFAHLFDGLHHTTIVLSGLDAAGKSTILRNHISLDQTHAGQDVAIRNPLQHFPVEVVTYPSDIVFLTVDAGGSAPRNYKACERGLIGAGDAIVWVVDASDRDRLVESREELLYRFARTANSEEKYGMKSGIPVLMLINKQDLEQAMSIEEIKQGFGDTSAALNGHPWTMFEMGANPEMNIHRAFSWLADRLMEADNRKGRPKEMSEVSGTMNTFTKP
ncbi:ADP-ribosylation factor family-domain-containing protein [Massariosphaeria phaeospora]|uniref:ADP-ribosylation factor family-domain-containing protein n=1 Tax=Massariosphaeria phaeospora TaxID=100035 RepID=A0A7C8M0C1_9PLEO|nr:ADP-ribosylation factor family-domain-containing protein [Massariosphaeria phaeospora]